MLRFKDGVDMAGARPEIVLAMFVTDQVYESFGKEFCWITSIKDSTHMPGSLHYVGLAFDVGVLDLPFVLRSRLKERLALYLGRQFDVVLESDHIHVEFDPKEKL